MDMKTYAYDRLSGYRSAVEARPELNRYLAAVVRRQAAHPERSESIAYDLAGLLSLPILVGLPDDHPYVEILTMAGQLELPPAHRDPDASWDRLAALVAKL